MNRGTIQEIELQRNKYKVTHKELCKLADVNINTWHKVRRGERSLNVQMQQALFNALDTFRDLQAIKDHGINQTIVSNISSNRYKFEKEIIVSDRSVPKENDALWRDVEHKQHLIRNSHEFNPSLNGSVDKITLSKVLTDESLSDLLEELEPLIERDPRTRYTHNTGYKSGFKTEYKHIIQYEGDDCKVHIQICFWDKKLKEEIRQLKVEFNPNKWINNSMLELLIKYLGYAPTLNKVDICIDKLGYTHEDVILGNFKGAEVKIHRDEEGVSTLYLGDKAKKGVANLMVYDKRREKIKKDSVDIGVDCLRLETRLTFNSSNRVTIKDLTNLKLPKKIYTVTVTRSHREIDAIEYKLYVALWKKGVSLLELEQDYGVGMKVLKYLESNCRFEVLAINEDIIQYALQSFVLKYEKASLEAEYKRMIDLY